LVSLVKIKCALLMLIALPALAGCVNQQQMLDNDQAMAVQTAVSRAEFDMSCPSATGTIISREVVQPSLQGPYVNGIRRAESQSVWRAVASARAISLYVPRAAMDASPPALGDSIRSGNN
jgi:hypothetical protein